MPAFLQASGEPCPVNTHLCRCRDGQKAASGYLILRSGPAPGAPAAQEGGERVRSDSDFIPPAHLRAPYAQTVLASSRIRTLGPNPMAACSREMIFDTVDGVRLQGFHSPAPGEEAKGLVILIHGWEGSASSTYILHTGRFLHAHGYDVFRLNLRDHGDTHHLNEGLFYATLLDEVFSAVKQAAALARGSGVYLAGFSLGGNFALRIACRCAREPIETLRHVMAVSPVVDPARSSRAIDNSGLLRWYFLKKWRRSLRKKQALYPNLYDFSGLLPIKTVIGLTEALIRASGIYAGMEEYFRGYTITGSVLEEAPVPTTILISRDDPAIPAGDFTGLRLAPYGKLIIHDYGGHNGFLSSLLGATWYEEKMLELF